MLWMRRKCCRPRHQKRLGSHWLLAAGLRPASLREKRTLVLAPAIGLGPGAVAGGSLLAAGRFKVLRWASRARRFLTVMIPRPCMPNQLMTTDTCRPGHADQSFFCSSDGAVGGSRGAHVLVARTGTRYRAASAQAPHVHGMGRRSHLPWVRLQRRFAD